LGASFPSFADVLNAARIVLEAIDEYPRLATLSRRWAASPIASTPRLRLCAPIDTVAPFIETTCRVPPDGRKSPAGACIPKSKHR
jgi:hypothetical protein